MSVIKAFIKKTKTGNFLKIVREHYLREDIFCGYPGCEQCIYPTEECLSKTHVNKCSLIKGNHVLILDTNVILHQMDALEEDTLGNVIILHTVLNEVKNRSLPIFKRLNSIIDNRTRHFYVFINDHNKETYLEQLKGETTNDYNDRCIRQACKWFIKHLPEVNFVFLSNDTENRQKALQESISSFTITQYVKAIPHNEHLRDKLMKTDESEIRQNQIEVFPPHLPSSELLTGVKTGKLLQGTYRASRDNFLTGTVNIDSLPEPVIVQGRNGQNRSVDGDTVVVELFPEKDWISPSEIVLEDEGQSGDNLDDFKAKEQELQQSIQRKKGEIKPTGRVVGIIRRKWRQYCGILQGGVDGVYQLFVPSDRSIPKIRIETRQAEFLRTQKLIVTIDCWPQHSRYPHGHFVRALGKIGNQATENEVVLLEHDVPHSQFSEEVLSCLPKLPWTITEEDLKQRKDLRNLDICSVDPPGCTDIDDALHCKLLPNKNYEIGVHIADVSHFIRPGTSLDQEAASRATTVYLVNTRIDMVPELLSSNLCSLRGGEERFAFSCIWEITKNAEIVQTKFHKSIIKSKKAMTYEEAQMIIDDKTKSDSIAESLRNLNKIAKILKEKRMEKGALALASPEVKILMDSETMEPLDVKLKKLFETNSMVEEFMLLANISVAEKILQDFPDCAMLRRHPTPPSSNFDPLIKAGRHLGFEINTESNKTLAKSLDLAEKPDHQYLNTMLRILATRCMLQAVYFASGAFKKDDYMHYGLAVPLYTHFTSPIRRYADIIVHRLLAVSCGADSTYPDLLDKQITTQLCQNLNYRNRMAQYAGRASVAFNTHLFFKGKLQDEQGYILQIRKNALQILIPKYGLEATLFLAKKSETSDIFTYNEEDQTQTACGVTFHAFDPVTVRISLDSNNIQHEKFILQLVKPEIKGFSVEPLESSQDKDEEVPVVPKKRKKNK